MQTMIQNRIRRMTTVLALLAVTAGSLLAGAAPAHATGWTYAGDGAWVWTNSSGTIEEIRIDDDFDNRIDVQVYTRSDGTVSWLGMDRLGGPGVESWVYVYSSGARWAFIDANEDGKYEVQGWDGNGDGWYDYVRLDTNSDGYAEDYWYQLGQAPQTISIPAFGTGMINVNNACDNSTYTCSGAGLVQMFRDFG